MNSLANDIRALIASRVSSAPRPQLLAIAAAICANDSDIDEGIATPGSSGARFTKMDASGRLLTSDSTEWVAVHDSKSGLIWTRNSLGSMSWKEAASAASALTLLGQKDWRLPTVEELLSLVDYKRCDPAIDSSYFAGDFGYTWSSTPDAEDPSGYAWFVDLGSGFSGRNFQSSPAHVRAVRAGQQLAFSV